MQACWQGTADRELHGSARGARHRQLLEQAEAKIREAMRRERDAEDSERTVGQPTSPLGSNLYL